MTLVMLLYNQHNYLQRGYFIEIKFSLDRDNIIEFQCSNLINTKQFKKGRIWAFIYMLSVLGFVSLVTERKDMRVFTIILGVIICIFFKVLFKIFSKILLNRIYKKSESSYIFDEKVISISEENIFIKNSLGNREILFNSISSLNLVDQYMFIVLLNKEYLLIPVSAFNTSEEKEQFIRLIEEKSNLNIKKSYPNNLKYI